LLAVIAVLAVAPATAARNQRTPAVELRIADRSRALDAWSSNWIYRLDGQCVEAQTDGIPSYRPVVEVHRRLVRAKFVFHKRARPDVQIAGYRRLNAQGSAVGRGRNYTPRLRPRIRAAEIEAWVARARIRVGQRQFVSLGARWSDRSGCVPEAFDEGASWSFALRRGFE
jgi:hypothetical protein